MSSFTQIFTRFRRRTQESTLGYLNDGWGSPGGVDEPLLRGDAAPSEQEQQLLVTYAMLSPRAEQSGQQSADTETRSTIGARVSTPVLFALPAACDITASTLLNLGLFYTYTSVYQMLRGTLVVFTGVFDGTSEAPPLAT